MANENGHDHAHCGHVHKTAMAPAVDVPSTRAVEIAAAAAESETVTIYTCPMHPQIRRNQPGNGPICGMTLEPLLPTLDADDNTELEDFTRRFWWTLPLTIVVTLLAMVGHRVGVLSPQSQTWVECVCAIPTRQWAYLVASMAALAKISYLLAKPSPGYHSH